MKIYSAQLKGTTTVSTGSNVSLTGSFSGSIYGFDDTIQYSSSVSSDLSNLESKSASVDISISNINQYTGSNDTKWTTLTNVTSSLIAATGSYATTGSNQFFGTQTFSGSVYIANDLIVQGSSSIQYISASSVSIGTNIVQLNTATPSVRYAGLSVQDSGSSAGITGSMLWDSLCNRWIYSNPSTIGYSGGMLLSGPRTQTLGTEPTLTCNYIAKSGGGDHLYDSCIIDDGTTTCIKNDLKVTGTACFASSVCVNNNVIIYNGSNSFYAWTNCSSFQPGLYGQICIGSGMTGVYTKMYGSDVNAGIFGINTQCMAFVGTDGTCGKGLIIGTANNAPIYVGTNNIEAFRVTTNQYLLLGSTQNSYKLEVTAPTNTNASYFRAGGTSGYAAVAFSGDGETIGVLSSTGCHVYFGTANNTIGNQFGTNGEFMIQKGYNTNILKLTCQGGAYFTSNLGIGVTSHPTTALVIRSGVSNSLLSPESQVTITNTTSGNFATLGFRSVDGDGDHGRAGITVSKDTGTVTGAMNFIVRKDTGNFLQAMRINSEGRITTPSQPAFMAYGNGNSSIEPNGTYMIYPTVHFNRGSHYNASTGVFTAPVDGLYFFSWTAIGNTTNDVYRWFLRVNNVNFLGDVQLRQDTNETGSAYAQNGNRQVLANLTAGSTVRIYFTADAGSQPYGANDAVNAYLNFMGYLIG